MQHETKLQIIAAANAYMHQHSLTTNELSRKAGINAAYLSNMLRNVFTVDKTEIADKWFLALAHTIGFAVKKQYWETIPTIQFMEHITILQDCKEQCRSAMIICNTGMGKTYNTDLFCKKNPLHTYRVTVGDSYKLIDVVDELLSLLGIKCDFKTYAIRQKLDLIAHKLHEIRAGGGSPIIILDESENLKPQVLKMIKELYDGVYQNCALVLIGTDYLLDSILNRRNKNRQSVPQLWRRFKAGMRTLSPIEKLRDFTPFFEKYVADKGLRKLLCEMCDNYGELHDYLEPALREADRLQQPLTEDLFRTIFNLPRFSKKAA